MASTHSDWTEVDKDAWEKTYESEHGDLLYIDDRLDGQTELTETAWSDGRYNVKLRPNYVPAEESFADTLYDGFEDLGNAEAYLDGLLTEL